MTFQPDIFSIVSDLGELHASDIERLRSDLHGDPLSLINPETLPSSAKGLAGGAGNSPCVVCQSNPCACPEVPDAA